MFLTLISGDPSSITCQAPGYSVAYDNQAAADPGPPISTQGSGVADLLTLPHYLFTEPKVGFSANGQHKGEKNCGVSSALNLHIRPSGLVNPSADFVLFFSKHDKQVVFLFHFNDSLDKKESFRAFTKADRCFCLMRFLLYCIGFPEKKLQAANR